MRRERCRGCGRFADPWLPWCVYCNQREAEAKRELDNMNRRMAALDARLAAPTTGGTP